MALPELRMCFADRSELEQELSNNLSHGRAFVRGAGGVQVLADCMLVIVRPEDGAELELKGQAVFVSDSAAMSGVGVELRPFDAGLVERLAAFARGERVSGVRERPAAPGEEAPVVPSPPIATEPITAAIPIAAEPEPDTDPGSEPLFDPDAHADTDADSDSVSDSGSEAGSDFESDSDSESDSALGSGSDDNGAQLGLDGEPISPDVQAQAPPLERMRKLNVTEQQKVARSGDLNDRVMLERIYGKAVWENLLHNPKLTIPEVARIARKGNAPRPLLEHIVENNTWIQAPMVRRALLGNPRVNNDAIMKLLRITPKHELRVIYKTTAYSAQVREAARKVLDL